MRRQTFITLIAFAVVCTAVLIGATGALAESTPHSNGVGSNYTVVLPNEKDHYPGNQNQGSASIWHLSAAGSAFEKTSSPKGLETIEYIVIWNQDIDFSQCTTENTRAFGVDRGNDDPNTQTDEGLLKHRENSQFNKHSIVVDFFDDESLAGSSTYFNATDQIVAVQADCYTMPTEPGWYQINARINGTGYNGNHIDEAGIKSHYFYICECASEKEARNKLGPPPSEGSNDQQTATATPKQKQGTATPGSNNNQQTATSTPKQKQGTATPGSNNNQTGTATPGQQQGTATASPGGTQGTQSPAQNDGGDGNDGGPTTPTSGSGPGFGALAAVLSLLAAALFAIRE